jgi:hypothetical protein
MTRLFRKHVPTTLLTMTFRKYSKKKKKTKKKINTSKVYIPTHTKRKGGKNQIIEQTNLVKKSTSLKS